MHQYPTVPGKVVFIRYRPTLLRGALVIHNNFSNRMALCRQWIIQVSALSPLDGSPLQRMNVLPLRGSPVWVLGDMSSVPVWGKN